MQNIPRIFLNYDFNTGDKVVADKEIAHYLRRVMRTNTCLVFNNGIEYNATLDDDDRHIIIGEKTNRSDPSNNLMLCFAPIKRIDDLLNMVTQMGVGVLLPVITERTVAHHVNWARMRKIIIEASEQSGRNSIPELKEPIKFEDLDLNNLIVADERFAHNPDKQELKSNAQKILIGPEGGFSKSEFEKLDRAGVASLSLGKTILRAELAGPIAIAKVLNK